VTPGHLIGDVDALISRSVTHQPSSADSLMGTLRPKRSKNRVNEAAGFDKVRTASQSERSEGLLGRVSSFGTITHRREGVGLIA
jgi:hypothetical protein